MTALSQRPPQGGPRPLPVRSVRRHLLSWVRDPLAAQLTDRDDGTRPVPARGRLTTGVTVNGTRVDGPAVELHGPGDIVGLDERQVVRTEPARGAVAAEPEYLAAIDFDDPALPWRLTPLAPRAADGLLRPWLVLVVVDADAAGVSFEPRRTDRLAVLTTPGRLLPSLAGSAAWAHADVVAAGDETVEGVLADHPDRAVSRLVCPTPLESGRRYLACVVPAFAHGVVAGLGDDPTGDTTGPAWQTEAAEVRLPVYYSWRFGTGSGGDFPTLGARLRAVVPADGRRALVYRGADPELDGALGDEDGVAAVLPALHPAAAPADEPVPPAWPLAMRVLLQRGETELVPPVHLGAHLGRPRGLPDGVPPWLVTLNTDPRLRAAAGIGAQVVREEQEALMSAAWAQAAALEQANTELRQGATARAVGDNLHRRHIAPSAGTGFAARAAGPGSDAEADVMLQRVAPVLGRLPAAEGTVAAELATHDAAAGAVTAAATRALRPTTTIAKRAGATATAPLVAPVSRLARAEVPFLKPSPGDTWYRLFDSVGYRTDAARPPASAVTAAPTWWRALVQNPPQRPLVTPGRHALMADVVSIEPVPGQPGALRITVDRDMGTDGVCRRPGLPGFTVPAPAGHPADAVLAGGVLVRGRDSEPALAVLYRRDEYTGGQYPTYRTYHLVRWITRLTQTGYGTASALTVLGTGRWDGAYPWRFDGSLSLTARRVPGGPDQMVVFHAGGSGGGDITALAYRQDGSVERAFAHIPPAYDPNPGGYYARSGAIVAAWLPPASTAADQTPTDVVVAMLNERVEPTGARLWELRYFGIRNLFGPDRVVGQVVSGGTVGPSMAGDAHLPTLDLAVTEVDSAVGVQLLAHVTLPYTSPYTGQVEWRTVQLRPRVAHPAFQPVPPEEEPGEQEGAPPPEQTRQAGPRPERPADAPLPPVEPAGSADSAAGAPEESAAAAVDASFLVVRPAAGPLTRRIVGDVDEARLTRFAGFADNFRTASAAHQGRTVTALTDRRGDAWAPAEYAVSALADEAAAALSPGETVTRRVLDRIVFDGAPLPETPAALLTGGAAPDPLRPRFYEPVFTQAMSGPLLTRFAELVAPGAGALPADGLALMTGNAELIAAYLAGVNAEFGRELLFRGYPSTGRATWFRRFFDTRGTTSGELDGDVLPIDEWGDGELRDVATGAASGDGVTLLVRAELLRRFPNTIVQAVPAVRTQDGRVPDGPAVNPTATGVLGDDLAMFTFPVDPDDLGARPDLGTEGYFFVFAEPPTQPRFGPHGGQPDWSAAGGPAAAALLRLPHRVAIHASDLLHGALPAAARGALPGVTA
jgi:hypothetical protein